MQFESDSFRVAGRKIRWGQTLSEVKSLLASEHFLKPHGGWPNVRIICKEAYEFPSTEFEARSPSSDDRPVMQVSCELSPPNQRDRPIQPDFWVQSLTDTLGPPGHVLKAKAPVVGAPWASVVYSARWKVNDVRLTLSVYGGLRENEAGISAACMSIDWVNEIAAAKPFLKKIRRLEHQLVMNALNIRSMSITDLDIDQAPFYVPDYTLSDPHIALANELLRHSQRALIHPELLETPTIVKQKLKKNQVALWTADSESHLMISTRWDSAVIESQSANEIKWVNILPAKGSGRMSLIVNELRVSDVHSSKGLTAVVRKIQEHLGYPIKCKEDYDA
jgi:hypothetical protein